MVSMASALAQQAFHWRRLALSHGFEQLSLLQARVLRWRERAASSARAPAGASSAPAATPTTASATTPTGASPLAASPDQQAPHARLRPEDFNPLSRSCFDNPYPFYQVLRNDYPVYQLPNGIYCISRYADLLDVTSDTETFASRYQGAIVTLKPGQNIERVGLWLERLGQLGVTPCDVLAVSDAPAHMPQRKAIGRGFAMQSIRDGEAAVAQLAQQLLDAKAASGRMDFVHDFGWRLPMLVIMRLLGLPDSDFDFIKRCALHALCLQNGIATGAQVYEHRAGAMALVRYCWRAHLAAKAHAPSDLAARFVRATQPADDGSAPVMNDAVAASGIFQLLVAGSDSSATSMGSALKMLLDNPELADSVRLNLDTQLDPFIEEVFRLEAAFQGHFRWTTKATQLHGVTLPRHSRVFLMWASGNRDERVFPNPDAIDLQRPNGKKHLTFGWGAHACLGRELARAEMRIVLRELLTRTKNLRQLGPAPYVASMFTRSLETLPIAFALREAGDRSSPAIAPP